MASPRDAIAAGFGFAPEDRKTDGIIGDLSVRENIVLALQARRGWARPMPRAEQNELAERLHQARWTSAPRRARSRSGSCRAATSRRSILARWLAMNPRFLILDEPTRGIDVGAHAEIMRLIERAARRGHVRCWSSRRELDELVAVCRPRHRGARPPPCRRADRRARSARDAHRRTPSPQPGRRGVHDGARCRRIAPQLLALAALIALRHASFFPDFFNVSYDGRPARRQPIIDVLKRGAPVALLAIGMTLVIATEGIDLSVGAVMAICGRRRGLRPSRRAAACPRRSPLALAAGLAAACGTGCWSPSSASSPSSPR